MSHGLVFGKFYPPHEGHHLVIDTAAAECDHITVLVMGHPSEDATLTREQRLTLLKDRHPGKQFRWLEVENALEVDYKSRRHDRMHAELIHAKLRESAVSFYPDRLYGSERYIETVAADLSELHSASRDRPYTVTSRIVDLHRVAKPVHATDIRRNPVAHWDTLAPGTKAHFTKRIVVCGGESTGTTTLCRDLAERYQTVWVPEWGRMFSEGMGTSHRWTTADFELIAREQERLTDEFARRAGPVMFCDTDAMATAMFHELYMHGPAPSHMTWFQPPVLYILTHDEGVAFEQDGYRLFESQRRWATEWFDRHLPVSAVTVTGTEEERLGQAVEAIEPLLKWDFAPAGDELHG